VNATFGGNTSFFTLMNSKIKVMDPFGAEIAGTNSYDNESLTVTFKPLNSLSKGIKYTVIFEIHVYRLDAIVVILDPTTMGVSPPDNLTHITYLYPEEFTNTTLTWNFSTGAISKPKEDEDEFGSSALILWLIYVIVIIIILVVIVIFFKRRRTQPEPEPSRDQYLYEEDWSAEVRQPGRQKPKKKKKKRAPRDDGIEWDEDKEGGWKPPVVEWEDIEKKTESAPSEMVVPPRRHEKKRAGKGKPKKVKPLKKPKRKR
jgi:hypothetical protein